MSGHIWVRAEQRASEQRVGLSPEGVVALRAAGFQVTVEDSHCRAIPIDGYRDAGATIAAENSWPDAPRDAIIFGLKELPEDGSPCPIGISCSGMPSRASLMGQRCCGGFRRVAAVFMILSI